MAFIKKGYTGSLRSTRLKHTKFQRWMGSYADWVSRILTIEVDEIQIEQGIFHVVVDSDGTSVEANTDDTEDGPYDALNLEWVIEVYLEYHQLLLVL